MIITQENRKVVASKNFDSVNCTIDAEDMRYVASLLRNNYSNTQLAVIREISANALDANIEANATRRIEVKLPTSMNPTFAVRDFGGGLSQEDVFGLYSKYGKSTKRESNNYIGAFGIGKFATLSYGDNFTCVSYHNGKKATYNIFVNEDDDTKISRIGDPVPTDEPTGLSIEVAVADNDVNSFRETSQNFFQFFPSHEMPYFIGVEDDFIKPQEKVLASDTDDWFFLNQQHHSYYGNGHIVMGRVAYKIEPSSIQVENYISDDSSRRIVETLLNDRNFYIRLPLGSVKLHHSRESLEYNKSTQKSLCKAFYQASKEIQEIAKEKLQDSTCLYNARQNFAQVVNALPYQIKEIFKSSFEWNDIRIESPTFDREYRFQDNLIISHYEKEKDNSARNNFKLKHNKTSRIYAQKNTLLLVQDLASSHGNNLRVRTLMNEDADLENVYIVRPIDKKAEDYLWETTDGGMGFQLINKKLIRFTSNVEKEKIVRNKVSGKSRASIPLFKMTKDKGYGYRNADYWSNVSDPINSIEIDNVEGSINGKLVYVPIKNYKIESEGLDQDLTLENVYGMYKAVRNVAEDNSEQKDFVLFGVRKNDVKKLDSEVWVSFFDLYLDICKKLILKNQADGEITFKKISLSRSNDFDSSKYAYGLARIIGNKTFDISSFALSHPVSVAVADWKVVNADLENTKVSNAINYVLIHDKEWLEMTFDSVDGKSMQKRFDLVTTKYPLLHIIGNNVHYNWTDLSSEDEEVNNKVILDYISLCDGVED